jgi:hypothetical protein
VLALSLTVLDPKATSLKAPRPSGRQFQNHDDVRRCVVWDRAALIPAAVTIGKCASPDRKSLSLFVDELQQQTTDFLGLLFNPMSRTID